MSERMKNRLAHVAMAAAVSFGCSLCYVFGQWSGRSEGYADGYMDGSAHSLPPLILKLDDGTMAVGVTP